MKAFVTGATGFLGGRLVARLIADGWDVVAHGRSPKACDALEARGVRVVRGNLADRPALLRALRGSDRVFHVAALSSPWGTEADFEAANVVATRNVVEACLEARVGRLVFTSSPSIYIDGTHQFDVREDAPLPRVHVNAYARTKALAEAEVRAGAARGLEFVTLRPQALVGAGDTSIFPRLVRANREGGVPVFEGGSNLLDLTHVENVVTAHVLAATAPAERAAGGVFNITNGTPKPVHEVLTTLFEALGEPLRTRELPFGIVYAAATATEAIHRVLLRGREPRITRYGVVVLARTRTLNISAARERLGYMPGPSVEDGLQEFAQAWKHREATHGA
jgi:nucleoside-diphosphate-sugar epimerase